MNITVSLRRLIDSDAPVIASLCNNEKIVANLRDYIPFPYSVADGENFIHFTRKEDPALTFGITLDGALCGVIGIVPATDIYRKGAEIGYWVGEPFWGKGVATEAVRLMTEYAFETLGFARIHTGVMAHNPGSVRVLEKNGYQHEGVFKNGIFKKGVFVDEIRLAILNPAIFS